MTKRELIEKLESLGPETDGVVVWVDDDDDSSCHELDAIRVEELYDGKLAVMIG